MRAKAAWLSSGRAPVAPGPAAGPTNAGAGPAGVSAVSSDPLATTLAGGAAGTPTTPLGASGSGVALVAGGKDPQIGVLGIAPETGARLSFEPTAFRGLLTPAGLLAAATDDSLAGSHPSGGGGVIEQVAHAVDGVIAKLPDWSRPIIAGLLVLLLLFGGNSWRTRRRAKKAGHVAGPGQAEPVAVDRLDVLAGEVVRPDVDIVEGRQVRREQRADRAAPYDPNDHESSFALGRRRRPPSLM